MFEDIKSGTVVNGIKVIHVKTKSPREQFLSYGIGEQMRELTKQKITPKQQMEKELLVKKMRNEYRDYLATK